jgi:hypothetical protein
VVGKHGDGQVDNVVELTIEVPGLAEKRPAVVYGDELTVRPKPQTHAYDTTQHGSGAPAPYPRL